MNESDRCKCRHISVKQNPKTEANVVVSELETDKNRKNYRGRIQQ